MATPFEYELNAIRLENFMGFKDSGWIELRPITLLFGRNSAGKSAFIRALLLLKQNLNSNQENNPLIFVGDMVDLGTYYNAVHEHDISKNILFAFRILMPKDPPLPNLPENSTEEDKLEFNAEIAKRETCRADWAKPDKANVNHRSLELSLSFGFDESENRAILKSIGIFGYRDLNEDDRNERVQVFELKLDESSKKWIPESNAPLDYDSPEGIGDSTKTVHYQQFAHSFWKAIIPKFKNGFFPSLEVQNSADIKDKDYPPDLKTVISALKFFENYIRQFFDAIEYLPPLREEAKRYYRNDVKWVRSFISANSSSNSTINQWLKEIGLRANIKAESIGTNEGLVGLYITELNESEMSFRTNLRDVGTGLSQAFPIIARSIAAPNNSLIIIEQPELHLHPAAQAVLADVFIRLSKQNKRFLIETHSSSLINRLRRRVAENHQDTSGSNLETSLSNQDLHSVFVERKASKSVCTLIYFQTNGEYKNDISKLTGFFSSDANELTLMRTASVDKKIVDEIEDARKALKRFEHLFGGDSVEVFFAILGLHPASSVRMMRVWVEFLIKSVAQSSGINVRDGEDSMNMITRELLSKRILEINTKNLVDSVRNVGNSQSHANPYGIGNPSVEIACLTLKYLILLLEDMEKKSLIKGKE